MTVIYMQFLLLNGVLNKTMGQIIGKYTIAHLQIEGVEQQCIDQIGKMVNHPAFTEKISIMPDTHAGKGSVIGFTMPLTEKVIPNVVGVDIGCGMLSFNVGKSISENKDKLLKVDEKIRSVIPFGNNLRQRSSMPSKFFKENFPWDEANETGKMFVVSYNKKFKTNFNFVEFTYDWFLNKQKQIGMKQDAELAVGTLGGGNHFIEIGKSANTGDIWTTIHCGSRNFGKEVCDFHQEKAKKLVDDKRNFNFKDVIDEIKKTSLPSEIGNKIKLAKEEYGLNVPDENVNGMEYLEGQDAMDYLLDMVFTQIYAKFNRKTISDNIIDKLGLDVKESIECTHNYINFNDMIIRKGSISSYVGEKMIIPFNMADGLLICEGKSNPDWNYSAPHGAGRLMSRGEASRKVDLDKFKFRMKGIVSTSVGKSTLDESPQAYKNPKMIEKAIEPTATILDRVKPILNLKDGGETLTWKERKELAKKDRT